MNFTVDKTSREKYSEIQITWWEAENITSTSFMWWLPEVQTFDVGGEEVRIPITGGDSDDLKVVFNYISPVQIYSDASAFPVKDTQSGSKVSRVHIWGEDDNIAITQTEFTQAGGSVSIDFDPETLDYELVVIPPSLNIGTNSNFSISLASAIPGAVIAGYGVKFHKRVSKFRTPLYGKVHSTLEVEYPFITNLTTLYDTAQKLIEKHHQSGIQFNFEYHGEKPHMWDNNNIVPQSVTIESNGRVKSSNGFHYNKLGNLTTKTLSEINQPNVTLGQLQYFLRAYIN